VLAFIGWQHDHEHRQLVEIQRELNQRGVEVNERHTGRLYRQFLALLSASREPIEEEIAQIAAEYGGLIWAVDALQPEGNGRLLYVLYEVQSGKPLAAFQGERVDEADLVVWLRPYQELSFCVWPPYRMGRTRSSRPSKAVGLKHHTSAANSIF